MPGKNIELVSGCILSANESLARICFECRIPSIDTVAKIAEALKVTIDYLVKKCRIPKYR